MPVDVRPVWNSEEFQNFVPSSGWCHDYLEYACACTDAPPMHHILTSLAMVSAAIAPRAILEWKGVPHTLNEFFLIVGDAGSARKGTSIKQAVNVAAPALQQQNTKEARIWQPALSSPEGLIDGLAAEPNRLMIFPEWTQLHRMASASYWSHSSELWNQLYDGDSLNRIKANAVSVNVESTRVTILGASTTSLIKEVTAAYDWHAGKLSRYVIGYAPTGGLMLTPLARPDLLAKLQEDYFQLVGTTPSNPTYTLSDEAWELFAEWQMSRSWREAMNYAVAHLKPSFARAPEHAYRLATLFQASIDYPWRWVVRADAMLAALNVVDTCTKALVEQFTLLPYHDSDPLMRVEHAIRLAGRNGIAQKDLVRQTRLTLKKIEEAVVTLIHAEHVEMHREGTAGKLRRFFWHDDASGMT